MLWRDYLRREAHVTLTELIEPDVADVPCSTCKVDAGVRCRYVRAHQTGESRATVESRFIRSTRATRVGQTTFRYHIERFNRMHMMRRTVRDDTLSDGGTLYSWLLQHGSILQEDRASGPEEA